MIEVLKFYANFCAPCRVVSQQLKGRDVTKINISKTQEQATKYNVRSVPMLIFLKNDVEIYRHKGIISTEEFDDILATCS